MVWKIFQVFSSHNQFRMAKHVTVPYMLIGGSLTLSYQLILDFLHHHNSNTDRPQIIDHLIATCTIGTISGVAAGKRPVHALTGFMLALFIVAPTTWYVYKTGKFNAANRPANIFYENGLSKEEI
jgi:hypothetical protein